jgi:hypothetical protein
MVNEKFDAVFFPKQKMTTIATCIAKFRTLQAAEKFKQTTASKLPLSIYDEVGLYVLMVGNRALINEELEKAGDVVEEFFFKKPLVRDISGSSE